MNSHGTIPILVLLLATALASTGALEFEGEQIERGTRAHFTLDVLAGEDDGATTIPITILHGASPGKTLLVVSGIHGYEFAPILATERMSAEIDPTSLSGTVILVRCAHIPAFENRSPVYNPFDRKNLNRAFPGNAKGTQTERIAWTLSSKVFPLADFVIDVHSGDGAEWLSPFVGVYGGPLASEYGLALRAAEAMSFPTIVKYSMNTQDQIDKERSCNREAVARQLPTLLVEIGQNGSSNREDVDAIVRGLERVLVVLDIRANSQKSSILSSVLSYISPSRSSNTQSTFWNSSTSVKAKQAGIWKPLRPEGHYIQKGELIGEIRNFRHEVVQTVTSPVSGFALYGLVGPPVNLNDEVVTIALPFDTLEKTGIRRDRTRRAGDCNGWEPQTLRPCF